MPAEARAWIKALITPERSAATVKRTWLNAANTVFRWALDHKHVGRNPFADVKVAVPKKKQLRETRAFYADEARIILSAAYRNIHGARSMPALGAVALCLHWRTPSCDDTTARR